ncbi:MAG TPA: hypothetical protein VF642_12105, partial [Propionibacteriaceae bacterium]
CVVALMDTHPGPISFTGTSERAGKKFVGVGMNAGRGDGVSTNVATERHRRRSGNERNEP